MFGKKSRFVFRIVLILAVLSELAVVAAPSAQSQTFNVLYSFSGQPDGAAPFGGLVTDKSGMLYGTTTRGGASCSCGTVFMLDSSGKETILYRFAGYPTDGTFPYAGLVRDAAGNLYGTTVYGGASDYGVAFKLDKTNKESVLHSFTGVDGLSPYAGLIRDSKGNLYGTTDGGGSGCIPCGTVFKLNNAGRETVLHSFRGYPTDGALPEGGLVRDAAGNLYGTTPSGGTSDYGAAFELNKTGKETVLHSFADMDGANPEAGLIRDGGGDLYGTTASGGAYQYGTVFELTSNGAETVLYSFAGGSDGEQPMAGLARDKAGNLYGTTLGGGAYGYGTVFKLTPSKSRNWKESVLYSFTGETDGAYPYAGVIEDAQGNLYGTAADGGSGGNGTVWKLTP